MTKSTNAREIKSLNEIKAILKRFPEASGVGYVIAPQVAKIAWNLGLVGYDSAVMAWLNTPTEVMDETAGTGEHVFKPGEALPAETFNQFKLIITWDGPALRCLASAYEIGLKLTLESIEAALR
jgi:hypothetical protein